MMNAKTLFIHTTMGHILLQIRSKYELFKSALTKTESVGTLANDQLAFSLITRLCRSNRVFLDVGAHIGSVTSEVLYHDSTVQVIAFEAIPEKAAHLKKTFPAICVHECAVGSSQCEVPFFVHQKLSGYSSLNIPSETSDKFIAKIRVKMKTLDSVLESVSTIDAIKIDVEGAELQTLRGGRDTLMRNRPVVMFESCVDDNDYQNAIELWSLLDDLDYVVLLPNRLAHEGKGLSKDSFLDSHVYPRRSTNYFAVPNERRTEFCSRARDLLGIRV